MSGTAILRRLHDAGVQVQYVEPNNIKLSGPLTHDLVELARGSKSDLLALVRPRVQVQPCACCGRFFFAEPATMCFWCRPGKHGDKRDKSPACEHGGGTSVPSVPTFPGAAEKRTCPSCGGGLDPTDPAGEPCFTCRGVGEER